MSWQFWYVLLLFFTTCLSLQRRRFSKMTNLPVTIPTTIAYVIGVMPIGIIAGLIVNDYEVNWSWLFALQLAMVGFFIGTFNWLSFKAYKKLNVATFQSIFQPVFTLTAVLVGWVALNETLNSQQIIGGIFLLIGAVFAAQSHKSNGGKLVGSAVVTAIIGTVSLALGAVAEKAALDSASISAYFLIGWGAQTIAMIIIASKDLRRLKFSDITRNDWKQAFILGCILGGVGISVINMLTITDNVGFVFVLNSFQLPLVALAGWIFLRERNMNWKLIAGLVIGFAGLIITNL